VAGGLVAAMPSDWDALPDPTNDPDVAGELPRAGYMPEGAPVGAPNYASGNYPMGAPYKAPDGTTVQPMASVTNITNTNTVNVSTYNITTHNADGSPTNNPLPEPTDEQQDHCEKNPETAGCAKLGEYSHPIPTASHVFEFAPEVVNMPGSCPAPIPVLGSSLSFQPACDAMSTIKPLVVGMAAIMAALILFGGMRGAD